MLRTFSKAYRMAGIRAALLLRPDLLAKMRGFGSNGMLRLPAWRVPRPACGERPGGGAPRHQQAGARRHVRLLDKKKVKFKNRKRISS